VEFGNEKALVREIGFSDVPEQVLEERALQRRVDTKFILNRATLEQVLSSLAGDYGLLKAAGEPVATYRTLYFDTEDLLCLREHHCGRRPRYKVRVRHYTDRRVSFLEVKRKTSADTTVKERRSISYDGENLAGEEHAFINDHNPIDARQLVPGLRTDFGRITLVGLHTMERVTFDVRLGFAGDGRCAELPGAIVAEVKQDRIRPRSPVMLALRGAGVRPASMSKYCTAAMLLLPDIPLNRFRPTLRTLRQSCDD